MTRARVRFDLKEQGGRAARGYEGGGVWRGVADYFFRIFK